jgi:hypothetical protein
MQYWLILIRPSWEPSTGTCGTILLTIFMILHYPDLPLWAMIVIAAFFGYVFTVQTAVFVLGWIFWALYTTYL